MHLNVFTIAKIIHRSRSTYHFFHDICSIVFFLISNNNNRNIHDSLSFFLFLNHRVLNNRIINFFSHIYKNVFFFIRNTVFSLSSLFWFIISTVVIVICKNLLFLFIVLLLSEFIFLNLFICSFRRSSPLLTFHRLHYLLIFRLTHMLYRTSFVYFLLASCLSSWHLFQ